MACYFLLLRLDTDTCLQVGKKGVIHFAGGMYLYVGRARRGVLARLRRHLDSQKRKHWHIDFLREKGKITHIVLWESDEECVLAAFLRTHPLVRSLVPGFGSSDCGCPSHLFFFGENFSFSEFLSTLRELPFPFWVFFAEEVLHHPGVADRIVPETVVEHEKDPFGTLEYRLNG